jgi:hypothetical protein
VIVSLIGDVARGVGRYEIKRGNIQEQGQGDYDFEQTAGKGK